MKLRDLTPRERRILKKNPGRRCDCALTYPDTCDRCLRRGLRVLLRRAA